MSKSASSIHILTANRLSDGAAVFLNFDGDWATDLVTVVVARSPDEARGLDERGAYDAARNLVVDPYLIEMREELGALVPVRQRERLRLAGPSILADVPGYAGPTTAVREARIPIPDADAVASHAAPASVATAGAQAA